jgi:hypothetical protein
MKKWLISLLLVTLLAAAAVAALTTTQTTTTTTTTTMQTATAADHLAAGKNYLNLHQILAARDQFKQAAALEPDNQEANFLYGITRVFAVYEDSQASTNGLDSIRRIFELSGFTFDAFGLYNTTLVSQASTLPATTPSTGAVQDYFRSRVLPEVEGAIANLSKVTGTGFSSTVVPSYIDRAGSNLSADYPDALVVRSLLYALQGNINLLLAYNMNVHLPDIQNGPDELGTYKRLLANDATLLTVKDPSRLEAAKSAILNFISAYNSAVPLLKARAGSPYHLFVVDTETTDEPVGVGSGNLDDVTSALAELKATLNGPHPFSVGAGDSLTVDASKFLSGTTPLNLRALIGNCSTGEAFPDRIFGGVLPQSFARYPDLVSKVGPHLLGVACSDSKYDRPFMELDPPGVTLYKFGSYSSGTQHLTIRNHGTGPLYLAPITLTGSNMADFVLTGGTCGNTAPTIGPGNSCSVDIGFNPASTSYGFLMATAILNSNDVDRPYTTLSVFGSTQAPPGGTISGHVRDAVSRAGLTGVYVSVYNTTYGYTMGGTNTDADGAYAITGLPCGSYKVMFGGYGSYNGTSYGQQWYNNKNDFTVADTVTLTSAGLSLGDTYLTQAGSITGRVTDTSGNGVSNCSVNLTSATGYFVAGTMTDYNGYYTVNGVSTGSYKVQFYPYQQGLLNQYYGGALDAKSAAVVTVTAPATTANIDMILVKGGSISGHVTDSSGNPIMYGNVLAYQVGSGTSFASTYCWNGNYSFAGLPPGSYKLQFASDSQYEQKFYNGKQDLASADTVTVTAGADTGNIDTVLGPAVTTLSWGNIYHVMKSDGTVVDQIDAGINTTAATLTGMTLTVTGPGNFKYTFTDADMVPYIPGKGLSLSKGYTTPLAPGVYTFTLTDSKGRVSHRVDTHVTVTRSIAAVNSGTIQFLRKQDGSYRISWAPINDTQTYFYRVRISANDSSKTPVFFSSVGASAYADIPVAEIAAGVSYKVRVEAFDAQTTGVATIRSDSPWTDFAPQIQDYDAKRILIYPYAFNVVDSGSSSYLFGFSVGNVDPTQVSAASVTGPNGFSYTYSLATDRNGSDFYKGGTSFNVAPAPGLYTFKVTANGITQTAYAGLTAPLATPYPAPDSSTYQATDLGNGKIRFSWANVNRTGALYYRVSVDDTGTGLSIKTPRANQTFADVAKSSLGDLSTKKWRVEVGDSADVTTQRNRTNGGWKSAPLVAQAYDPANPVINSFRLRNQKNSDGKDYTQISVNASAASSTLASVVVTGPSSYSRDLLASGRFSPSLGGYTLEEAGSFAAGLYTLKVKDNFGRTATGYFYKPAAHAVPQVDYHSFYLDQEVGGSLRLSWAPVTTDVPLWYEVSLYPSSDTDGDGLAQRVVVQQSYPSASAANVYPLASVVFPSTMLSTSSYVVVRAYDGSSSSTVDNFSSSVAAGVSGKVGADFATAVDNDKDGYAGDADTNDGNAAVYPFAGGNDSLGINVVATTPAAKAIGLAQDAAISVTFNKAVDQRTLPASFTVNNGVTGATSYDPYTRTATFIPTAPLKTGTQYTAAISTALKDQGGKALGSAYSWSFTTGGVPPKYIVNAAITGSGSINGLAPGASYSCAAGACSASYGPATQLVLHPSPAAGYQFGGWTGACASFGTGDCLLTLNQDMSLGASFRVVPNARIGGIYYPTLENAFSAAVNGSLIQSQGVVFTSTGLVFNRPGVTVKLVGGYESSFTTNNAFTVIDGKLLLDAGTLKVQKLKIK